MHTDTIWTPVWIMSCPKLLVTWICSKKFKKEQPYHLLIIAKQLHLHFKGVCLFLQEKFSPQDYSPEIALRRCVMMKTTFLGYAHTETVYLTVTGTQEAYHMACQLPGPKDLQWPRPILKPSYPLIKQSCDTIIIVHNLSENCQWC